MAESPFSWRSAERMHRPYCGEAQGCRVTRGGWGHRCRPPRVVLPPPRPLPCHTASSAGTHRPAASAQVLDGSCRSLQDSWSLAFLQEGDVYPHHFWLEEELVACQEHMGRKGLSTGSTSVCLIQRGAARQTRLEASTQAPRGWDPWHREGQAAPGYQKPQPLLGQGL